MPAAERFNRKRNPARLLIRPRSIIQTNVPTNENVARLARTATGQAILVSALPVWRPDQAAGSPVGYETCSRYCWLPIRLLLDDPVATHFIDKNAKIFR
jgi:hypothetical protein